MIARAHIQNTKITLGEFPFKDKIVTEWQQDNHYKNPMGDDIFPVTANLVSDVCRCSSKTSPQSTAGQGFTTSLL